MNYVHSVCLCTIPDTDSRGSRHFAKFGTVREARHSDDQLAPTRPLAGDSDDELTSG